jgi:hypothetical protein
MLLNEVELLYEDDGLVGLLIHEQTVIDIALLYYIYI